ncbi:hypothetical protein C8E87_2628 [Paractinoplanes brasiliensis]|uniref:HNH endonuclease n=2 Tax=Paractinoplanes brasiliensis TaxID=52695 RepID=A0A4V3C7U2_9ACTN|nr:hypothetical protein C8E87_2628 [Actinoplanes brasiliensis]
MTDADRKRLWSRAGNQCAWPACRQEVVAGNVGTAPHGLIIGEEAHIISEADDGPRADPNMPLSERNSYGNIVLLCPTHHTFVDKEEGAHYSAEYLHKMKREHEALVSAGQAKTEHGITRQNMSTLVDEWATRVDFDDWPVWTGWMLDVQPRISMDRFSRLRSSGEWLLARYWPESFPGTKKAMKNYLRIHGDFYRYFSYIGHVDGDDLIVRKYHHEIDVWDPSLYRRALALFEGETRTVGDLVVELTRAANFVFDEVRTEVDGQFRVMQGKLLIHVPQGVRDHDRRSRILD